jgi:hypothetical protein
VRILDRKGVGVAEADVANVIAEFCKRLEKDPDCRKVQLRSLGPNATNGPRDYN